MTLVCVIGWEWDCCSDLFEVVDTVDFGIVDRRSDERLSGMLDAELSATVDAVESHHEQELTDRLRGVVTAVGEVSLEHVERRELRRPGNGAAPNAPAPPPGEDWPFIAIGRASCRERVCQYV